MSSGFDWSQSAVASAVVMVPWCFIQTCIIWTKHDPDAGRREPSRAKTDAYGGRSQAAISTVTSFFLDLRATVAEVPVLYFAAACVGFNVYIGVKSIGFDWSQSAVASAVVMVPWCFIQTCIFWTKHDPDAGRREPSRAKTDAYGGRSQAAISTVTSFFLDLRATVAEVPVLYFAAACVGFNVYIGVKSIGFDWSQSAVASAVVMVPWCFIQTCIFWTKHDS
ncbi:hypothetical protein ACK3TF_004522 [Chlorella vulgaris]